MKILLSTFGPDPENTLAAMRYLPYNKLVLIMSEDSKDTPAFKMIVDNEAKAKSTVETLIVDEYDLKDCFRDISDYILEQRKIDKRKQNEMVINISGGSKILGDAALLAAFEMGVPAYHCEKSRFVRFPVLRGVTLRDRLTDSQIAVLRELGTLDTIDEITDRVGKQFTPETIRKALRGLRQLGVIRTVPSEGKITVELTDAGILILETIDRFEKTGE
ncbi:MAG: DUF6293 family protein [Thermoplasmata archaeon]